MSDSFTLGQKVEVIDKDVHGTIAYIGQTEFATGKWIGLVLDVPKGKNNGSVQGKQYFKCEDNFGMFVRYSQVVALDQHGNPIDKSPVETSKMRTNRQSISRISLASSRQSLASSRQSLAGSRQSLLGSRSQLASPNVDKTEGETTSQSSKRASFVETNFIETLKPHYTPGQAITSSTTPASNMEDKLGNFQLQLEIENREQQIKDLTEKMETLRQKRQEDKEKTRDFDKLKIQLEQLIEFKSKIMESQSILQRDLQRAKQEAKEAVDERNAHADEVLELSETVEMATLDKEMAEEKAESLQAELEACKEKLEEVTLDLETLKAEMQNNGELGGSEHMSSYEIKQLEQQNMRLKDTLVRMRDLSAHDKHEHQKLIKEMDQKKSEITELGRTKEKLSARVEQMEQQIADLQEQVDAALGAEEMVLALGQQKVALEELVAELQEDVALLEALKETNDQLVEDNAELELELREELDLTYAALRQAKREKEAAQETIADREATINKFRELVQKLQEQSVNLQQRLEKESNKPVSTLPEIMDFKKMISENKAHTKAIDLELRRVDIEQLQDHIKYLTAFMPDAFMNRGSDHDAILVLLLIPRLFLKSDLLLGKIKDKFPPVEKIDRASIIKGHSVQQHSFKCRVSYCIYALQAILRQYQTGLNICKAETFLNVGASYTEMNAQEKVLDGFIELIKRDQLDENVPTELLEKCVSYFFAMYPLQLGAENKLNQRQFLSDHVKVLISAFDGINNDAIVIRNLIEGANVGDIGLLAQHIITTVDQLQGQMKLIKLRIPKDGNITNLGLPKEIYENLYVCYQHAGKILKTLQDIVKNATKTISTSGESEKGLSAEKMKDLAINASDKAYEQEDLGPVQSIKDSLSLMLAQVVQLAQFLQDNECEISASNKSKEKPIAPILLRANHVKKELEQTKTLTNKLEAKESDIKELRKVIKEKQEQLSEMTIRKELAEKKLGNVNKDYTMTIEKLQRKLDEANNSLQKKEKEFEKTMDYLQADIDSLESEKSAMKEKLKYLSSKSYTEPLGGTNGNDLSVKSLELQFPAVVKDSPLLVQEINSLRKLFNKERDERISLQSEKLENIIKGLKPLPSFKSHPDPEMETIYKEGAALKHEILQNLATPKFPQTYKAQPGQSQAAWQRHFAQEQSRMLNLKNRAESYQSKVDRECIKRKFGGNVESDFTMFPTNEMAKALERSSTVNIGSVEFLNKSASSDHKAGIVNLDLDFQNLQKILQTLSY